MNHHAATVLRLRPRDDRHRAGEAALHVLMKGLSAYTGAPPSHRTVAMAETTIFEDEKTKVTTARFIVSGQTYAMKNIASVRALKTDGPRIGWAVVAFIAAVVLLCAECWWSGGFAILLALGAYGLKFNYHVVLTTNSGETKALQSADAAYVDRVVEALNDAMSAS